MRLLTCGRLPMITHSHFLFTNGWKGKVSIFFFGGEDDVHEQLAFDLANFLKELQSIHDVEGPPPGQHNE